MEVKVVEPKRLACWVGAFGSEGGIVGTVGLIVADCCWFDPKKLIKVGCLLLAYGIGRGM